MKQYIMKNNFSAGELAPTLYTRTDIQQYSNGAKTLKNVIPLLEGGVRKRPGTFFLDIKAGAIRLIPFVVNSNKAYMLILKPLSIDVYNPRSNTIEATVATPYTAGQIPDIQFVQYRYEMFFTHNDVPVQQLSCKDDYSAWGMVEFEFTQSPTDSENARYPFRKGKPSSIKLGEQVTFTISNIGAWGNAVSYLIDDEVAVTYEISAFWRPIKVTEYYKAIASSTGKNPRTEPTYWEMLSSSGDDVFSADDVGSYIEVNGGVIKITQFIDERKVGGEVVKKLTANVEAIERSWGILPLAFNAISGYPKCCTFFKQRLVLANTKKAPNKIWFSAVGGNGNFLETTEDGDAFSVVSASGLANSILFLDAQRGVICLTSGGEYMVDSDGALTPTTVNINEHTAFGAYPKTRPCRVGNELLFIQRGGERLRALSYRYEVDGLVSPELSALASHIGELHGGIAEITYQQEPESIVWCVLGDGLVASITFNRDQEVIAWAQHHFGGIVKSMCSTPTELGEDLCFMLVERQGSICLEQLSFDALLDSTRDEFISADKISKATFPYLIDNLAVYESTPTGMCAVQFNETFTDLEFNSMNSNLVYVGRLFECIAELFPPELSQAPLSSLLYKAKIDRTALFFNKTLAPEINGELIELFTFDMNPIAPQKPFTGYHLVEGGTWEDLHNVPLKITHNKPLPFHLQAITMQMSINEK